MYVDIASYCVPTVFGGTKRSYDNRKFSSLIERNANIYYSFFSGMGKRARENAYKQLIAMRANRKKMKYTKVFLKNPMLPKMLELMDALNEEGKKLYVGWRAQNTARILTSIELHLKVKEVKITLMSNTETYHGGYFYDMEDGKRVKKIVSSGEANAIIARLESRFSLLQTLISGFVKQDGYYHLPLSNIYKYGDASVSVKRIEEAIVSQIEVSFVESLRKGQQKPRWRSIPAGVGYIDYEGFKGRLFRDHAAFRCEMVKS